MDVKLHVDLETLQLIEGPGFRNPVTSLRFKRGDAALLEVSFLDGGTTRCHRRSGHAGNPFRHQAAQPLRHRLSGA
jgi:hypothetical protein